jgi:hypothetical protein
VNKVKLIRNIKETFLNYYNQITSYSPCIRDLLSATRDFFHNYLAGRYCQYPLCCTLWYSWLDSIVMDPPGLYMDYFYKKKRKDLFENKYVPCPLCISSGDVKDVPGNMNPKDLNLKRIQYYWVDIYDWGYLVFLGNDTDNSNLKPMKIRKYARNTDHLSYWK